MEEAIAKILFQVINWAAIEKEIHAGETGTACWQTVQLPGIRMRMVEYSTGYLADHWCKKGHIVHCLSGVFISELQNGETFELGTGKTYIVSDELSTHRSATKDGATLLIIDGGFLK